MPNIVKGFYITFFCLFLSFSSKGQELIDMNLDLNSGGKIYDIAIDPFSQVYLVVGDFNMVGTHSVNNFVAINMDDFTVNTDQRYDLINSVDGIIRCVEVYTYNNFGPSMSRYIYLGGNFGNIEDGAGTGNVTRPGFAAFRSIQYFSGPFAGQITDFAMDPWAPTFVGYSPGFEEGPYDFLVDNDTLLIGGNMYVDYPWAVVYPYGAANIAAYDLSSSFSQFEYAESGFGGIFNYITCIHRQNNATFIAGEDLAPRKIDPSGNPVPLASFSLGVPAGMMGGAYHAGYNIVGFQDSLLYMRMDTHSDDDAGDNAFILRETTGELANTHNLMLNYPTVRLASTATYKNSVFGFDANNMPVGVVAYEDNGNPITGINQTSWSANSNAINFNTNPLSQHKVSWRLRNMLFITATGLTNTLGQSRLGFAAYCLEPEDANAFIAPDTMICQGESIIYSFAASDYADGYDWSFSGVGVDLDPALGPPVTNYETTIPSITIEFLSNFTPGTLTVTPYSNCQGNTVGLNRVYSTPQTINIHLNPAPNALAGLDTVINCYNDSVVLSGHTDTLGASYSWNKLNTPFLGDSLGQNLTVHDSNTFILTVIGPNGCMAFDSVLVALDKTLPTFDPVPFGVLGCDDTIYFLGHCNNATDTTSWWEKSGDITQLQNPLECSTPGIYNFYTINNQNGCQANLSPSLNVPQVSNAPNIQITGYNGLPSLGVDLDTINCTDPFLSLNLYSDTANTTLNWVDSDTLNPIGDTQIITSPGVYYIEAYNSDNNCYNYNQVFIGIDTLAPVVNIDSPNALNCSNSSVALNGSTFADYVLQWDGNSIPSSSNPVTVLTSGYYTLTITDTSNGCVNQDSVFVIQDNSIDVLTSTDTVVCDQNSVPVSANYLGTITGISYLWSNGQSTPGANFIGGTDPYAIVEIFGDAGCYGTDTVFIDIPPAPVISFTGFQPCGNPNSGYIVASPISGWAPFDYSIDNGTTYQTSTTISGLALGSYTVTVRDSLNCEYDLPASISATSSIATPEFLFSTYNYQSDTVIVIDVSNPATDSVGWWFSPEIVLLDDNNGSPIIILPDTGSFFITMDGYYGTCISSITKEIFVSELDTNSANPYNDNGIKSIALYPNPTSGTFTVDVEFYSSQTATLSIQDMLGYVYDQEEFSETLTISQTFNMDAAINNGTYVLRVLSEFDSAYITFILNR